MSMVSAARRSLWWTYANVQLQSAGREVMDSMDNSMFVGYVRGKSREAISIPWISTVSGI